MERSIRGVQDHQGVSYNPSDAGQLSEESQRKLDMFRRNLCSYRDALAPNARTKMTDQKMRELALSLLDDTVFDIVQELEDIQALNERKLLHKRMKVVGKHKMLKMEMTKKHRDEVPKVRHNAHQLSLLKAEHSKEKAELDKKLADELKRTDQEVILELDQIVTDQQSTLVQAAVPFFSITNGAMEIQVQMHILRFIQKLSQFKEVETL